MPKAKWGKDCGVFAIAFAVALVFNLNASKVLPSQDESPFSGLLY